jgi:hypothetical protein
MRSSFVCLALACFGCGSSSSTKALVGSYKVDISSMGSSDPDVMTVATGASVDLLLTFAAGITTDPMGPNASGLRTDLHGTSIISLSAQPATIDHSTGTVSGSVTGTGHLNSDGSCDLFLHFTPTSGNAQDYEIKGNKI